MYGIIGGLTPQKSDCGRLCARACCRGDKDGDGMYLFPKEEECYGKLPKWASISPTDIKGIKLFSCDGHCERSLRPLSCRIFPLAPYNGGKVIIDPRARAICPLAREFCMSDFDADFVAAVRVVTKMMMKNSLCRNFIKVQSAIFDTLDFLGENDTDDNETTN
ncbi:MAG: hypothetical protein Q4C12_01235 [Clostridia bacterium]|nr:hypothetical protein [Clostridia bacterium]